MICRVINMLEAHEREGQWESSLYGKITAITLMSSTLLTAFVSPFVNTLDNQKRSFIPSMYAIFLADLWISPAIQLFDIPGFLKRHILGPRAPDQRRMNAMFQGTEYQLSARYTDMTKVLFMTFYTAFIFPAGWLIASLTLTVHYWVDKFCLLRIWAPSALIDNSIARMSRRYFFSSALAVFAVMMTFNFASFPFDNSCGKCTIRDRCVDVDADCAYSCCHRIVGDLIGLLSLALYAPLTQRAVLHCITLHSIAFVPSLSYTVFSLQNSRQHHNAICIRRSFQRHCHERQRDWSKRHHGSSRDRRV